MRRALKAGLATVGGCALIVTGALPALAQGPLPREHSTPNPLMSVFTSTNADRYAPTGDPSVGYPQMCIRTNRTAERTDMNEVVEKANAAADQYPKEDKENRAKAVTKALTEAFGSGNFGHTWINFYNSGRKGDATTYGYHEGYGFVKNGTGGGSNDSPERRFHVQRCVSVTDPAKQPAALEKSRIPELNDESALVAKMMGMPVADPTKGAYTPINNCAWFAANLWNYATDEKLVFTQKFDGKAHADYWGMPILALITEVADPGMVAESASTTLPFTTGLSATVAVPGSSTDVWMFRGDQYLRYNSTADRIITAPKKISDGWPGLKGTNFTTEIDAVAAVPRSSTELWMFHGDQYVRYNVGTDRVVVGPKKIAKGWPGLL